MGCEELALTIDVVNFAVATMSRDYIYRVYSDREFAKQARFCVRGRHMLYDYCREHGIPHKQIGKLIVATRPSEIPKLSELMSRGVENGVEGLRMMDGEEAMREEPELYCTKALLSPVSGIIDSHSLMLSLLVRMASICSCKDK